MLKIIMLVNRNKFTECHNIHRIQ